MDVTKIRLNCNEKKVLKHIEFRTRLSGWCFEFKKNMAARLGISIRTVYRCLRKLKELGLITVERRWICLTEKGRQVLNFLNNIWKKVKEIPKVLFAESRENKKKFHVLMLLKEKIIKHIQSLKIDVSFKKDYVENFDFQYKELLKGNGHKSLKEMLELIKYHFEGFLKEINFDNSILESIK